MADDLVERLRDENSDYVYTERHEAAARIEALEAALAEARRTALTECLRIAKAAQYSKAPATDTMRGIQKLIEDSPTPPPVV